MASWSDQLSAVATHLYQWLSRPRVRLTVTGVLLLMIGGLMMTSSVWTLPLIVVGALMVVTAWIGHRLDGRFTVEWGETGTQLAFRAEIRAPEHVPVALPAPTASAEGHSEATSQEPPPPDAEVIEGEAHTVEIDITELKALIAAVETAEIKVSKADPAAAESGRGLRVAYDGARPSEASR
jgi:hypothetical protein